MPLLDKSPEQRMKAFIKALPFMVKQAKSRKGGKASCDTAKAPKLGLKQNIFTESLIEAKG